MNLGPNNFFYFDGCNSGLILPHIERWPSTRGYSFCTWLRIESFTHPRPQSVPKKYHMPRLFSFVSEDGCGLELYFQEQKLCMSVTMAPGKSSHEQFDVTFRPKYWFHLAITHVVRTFGVSELSLFIDGKLRNTIGMRYPSVAQPLKRCFIATDGAKSKPQAFFGQMGPIYVFEDALTALEIETIYSVGPSYSFTFEQIDPALSSKIFLAYNAKARDQQLFLDNTPRGNRAGSGNRSMHAVALAGTHQCVTRHVKDVLHCLGGISVLFPLLEQLDLPVALPVPLTKSFSSITEISYKVDPNLLVQILRVFVVMIRNNPINQAFMKQSSGFAVIAYVLEQVPSDRIVGMSGWVVRW